MPFHGDFDFTPWAWEADVRVALAEHGLLELAVGDWRHSDTRVTQNLQVTGPGGPIGAIGRLEQTTTRVQRSVQANLLFTGAVGRLRLNGGGGAGFLLHDRDSRTLREDCSGQVTCGESRSSFSSTSATLQAVGGAEVALAGPLAAYGQLRLVVPTRDAGSSDFRITAGVRVGFGN